MPSTTQVHLRPLVTEDAAVIAGWALDEAFCRAAEWSSGLPLDEYVRFQRRLVEQPPEDLVRFGAEVAGELVGYVDLQGVEPLCRELGFVVGPSSNWNRGLGAAIGSAGLVHGFRRMGLDEIWAEAWDANHASVRVLQKLGMRETGRGDDGVYQGEPTQYRQFAMTALEFASLAA